MAPLKRLVKQYGLALATSLLAFLSTIWLAPWSDRAPFLVFLGAVLISAFLGSLRAGLAATSLSALFLLYHHSMLGADGEPAVLGNFVPGFIMFVLVGFLASYLSRECKQAIKTTNRLFNTISHMRDGIVFSDRDGKVSYINSVAESLTGWQSTEAIGRPVDAIFRLIDENSRQPISQPVCRVLRHLPLSLDNNLSVLVSRDATDKTIEWWSEPLPNRKGRPRGIILVFRDISERRRRELALKKREEQFRLLAARQPTAVLLLDSQGQCTFSNAACQAVAGFSPGEAAGDGWAKFLWADDSQVVEDWHMCLGEEKPFSAECRFLTGDDSPRWARLRSEVVRSDHGQVLGHVATLEDITGTKKLEHDCQRQRQITDELRKNGQDLDEKIKVQLADLNKAKAGLEKRLAERLQIEQELGRQLADLAKEKTHLQEQLANRQRAEQTSRADYEKLKNDKGQSEEELRQEVTRLTTAANVHQHEIERLSQEVIEHRDGRSRGEENLRQRDEELTSLRARLVETQSTEHTTIAVDEKTPFFETFLGHLRQILAATSFENCHPEARSSWQALTRLVGNVEVMSQSRRQLPPIFPRPLDMNKAIERAVAGHREAVQKAGHHLTLLLPLVPVEALADSESLTRVLDNILDNAIRHTPPDGRLRISADRCEEEIVVRIEDDGPGMIAEDIPEILNRTLDHASRGKESKPGLGMGLSVARRLVDMMGGTLEITSAGRGKGCEVAIHLPALTNKPSALKEEESSLKLEQPIIQV